MNLKEAFRYQNFLDAMMNNAFASITMRDHALKTTKTHLRHQTNPDATDETEVVDKGEYHKNDDVMALMLKLIDEKCKLSNAITEAKASVGFSVDAAVEANKFRQRLVAGVKNMLAIKPGKRKSQERGYKFDVNQVQVPYFYDVEVVDEDDFDRIRAKAIMRDTVDKADKVSTEIETALVNTTVNYAVPFNVNDSFDDVMAEFLA